MKRLEPKHSGDAIMYSEVIAKLCILDVCYAALIEIFGGW
jgi:hypothetical protein